MGIEEFKREIEEQARKEAREIIERAKKEAERIVKNAEEEMKRALERAREEAEREAIIRKDRYLADARMRAKRKVLIAQKEILDEAFSKILQRLKEKKRTKEYERYLKTCIEKAMKELGKSVVVYSSEEDRKLVGRICKELGVKIAEETITTLGGVIIENPNTRVRMNATFEAIVDEKREILTRMLMEKLFED